MSVARFRRGDDECTNEDNGQGRGDGECENFTRLGVSEVPHEEDGGEHDSCAPNAQADAVLEEADAEDVDSDRDIEDGEIHGHDAPEHGIIHESLKEHEAVDGVGLAAAASEYIGIVSGSLEEHEAVDVVGLAAAGWEYIEDAEEDENTRKAPNLGRM